MEENKSKTYFDSAILLVISAIAAYFTKTLHFMLYTNLVAAAVLFVLCLKEKKKEEAGAGAAEQPALEEPAEEGTPESTEEEPQN